MEGTTFNFSNNYKFLLLDLRDWHFGPEYSVVLNELL